MSTSSSPLRVGIGGPVGSGKTALVEQLCRRMRKTYDIAVVTNDIYTREDAEFLIRHQALTADRILGVETGGCPHTAIREDASMNLAAVADLIRHQALSAERIMGVETGGCPHTAIREDASMNLAAVADLIQRFPGLECIFVESGGDNLSATFSPELADLFIYVIDVAAGDKIPRKGGPGITRSDLLVINKIDLAPLVGASLDVMERDALNMRGDKPFLFTNMKTGQGLEAIMTFIVRAGMLSDRPGA